MWQPVLPAWLVIFIRLPYAQLGCDRSMSKRVTPRGRVHDLETAKALVLAQVRSKHPIVCDEFGDGHGR